MKPEQILLVSQQGWFRFAAGEMREIAPWPELTGAAVVVIDFADSQVGIQSTKGKPEYAAAQIEKVVRAEGAVEGPIQVFVHKQMRHADSCQTLYTAVALDDWQRHQDWAQRQRDHCMVVPLVAMLTTGSGKDEPLRMVRTGQQIHAYGESDNKMHYATAAAIGTDATDYLAPVRTMMAQLRASGWRSAAGVRWGAVRTDDAGTEQTLLARLAELGGLEARLLPHESFRTEGGKAASVLPGLLASMPVRGFVASGLQRLAWLSEGYVMPLAAMVAVVALGLGGLAVYAEQSAVQERQAVRALNDEMEPLRTRVAAATAAGGTGVESADLAFARQLGFAATHDPVRMLTTVRQAAGTGVRIQRVQLAKADQASKARFRIDGVVANGSSVELSRFLGALRAQGWEAESTTPNDGSVGAFAYHLRRVASGGNS